MLDPPTVNLELSEFPPKVTPNHIYRELHRSAAAIEYHDFQLIYTDGSKSDHGVGATAVWGDAARIATLPREASIFTAETHAKYPVKNIILENPSAKYIILSDSLSTLQKMKAIQHNNTHIRKL